VVGRGAAGGRQVVGRLAAVGGRWSAGGWQVGGRLAACGRHVGGKLVDSLLFSCLVVWLFYGLFLNVVFCLTVFRGCVRQYTHKVLV